MTHKKKPKKLRRVSPSPRSRSGPIAPVPERGREPLLGLCRVSLVAGTGTREPGCRDRTTETTLLGGSRQCAEAITGGKKSDDSRDPGGASGVPASGSQVRPPVAIELHPSTSCMQLQILTVQLFSRQEAIARNIQITAARFLSSGCDLGRLCGVFVSLKHLTASQLYYLPVFGAQKGSVPGLGAVPSSKVLGSIPAQSCSCARAHSPQILRRGSGNKSVLPLWALKGLQELLTKGRLVVVCGLSAS